MNYKVYDNGWNEGETSIEVSNDEIERGDFYLTIGAVTTRFEYLN